MSQKYVISFFKSTAIGVLLAVASGPLLAVNSLSVEQRLGRLENLMNSQVLIEQTQRLEQIQQELTSLRELLESQEHELGLIKQRQRNLYQDIDRRLNDLEIKGGGVSAVPMPESASSVPAPTTVASPKVVAAGANKGDRNAKDVYTLAFNTLKDGKYQQAIQAFKSFQENFSDSVYAANAQYWLGEAYSVTRDYKTALGEFQKVVSKYPQSNKVADAMLKIGYTYYEMQDWASAKIALENVISKYPGTAVMRKSKERLQRMKREDR